MSRKLILRVAAQHQVRISDKAPRQFLINQVKKDPRIQINMKLLKAIYLRDTKQEIGCVQPYQEGDWWRIGPIFILPEFRKQGYGEAVISNFFQDKKGRAFIEYDNHISLECYKKTGFNMVKDVPELGGAWYANYNLRHSE